VNSSHIVLSGVSPKVKGQKWHSEKPLRIGRMPDYEICVDETSVSRRHAEVTLLDASWVVRDLGSTNGTIVNGIRVGPVGQQLQRGDVFACGEIVIRVDKVEPAPQEHVRTATGNSVTIQAIPKRSWDMALNDLLPSEEQWQRQGKEFLALLQTGYRICHGTSLEESLQRILLQMVKFFATQRAGVFLIDPITNELAISSVVLAEGYESCQKKLSKTLAQKALSQGQSLLCHPDDDDDGSIKAAPSVAQGAMSSIICAILRSPERPLGVLHLDRGPLQDDFTQDDFFLADSLAAVLSLSIERLQMILAQQNTVDSGQSQVELNR
jgi:hypothetical protein